MAKTVISLGRANTGLTLAAMTVDFCKKISDGAAVSQEGMSMREEGVGVYVLDNANVTEDTTISLYKTGDTSISGVGIFSPVDGDVAKNSTVAKEATLNTIAGDIDTEITAIANAIAALQADLGDPSVDATTIYAKIQALQAAVAEIPAVIVLSGATASGNTYLRKGGTWTCKRGDFGFNIPFDLGMDITGYTLKWAMKKSFAEDLYIVNPTTIAPQQISDWLLGLGTIPVTSGQTEQVPQTYYIEIEITKGTDATLSPWDGKLKIEYDIIRPV